jgi:Tfp pilus assembly protein PilO
MEQRGSLEDKERYDIFRHHAWAGTALLSVLLALRYMIPQFPDYLFIVLCTVLIVYIVVSLLYTFRYRQGLSQGEMSRGDPEDLEEANQEAKIEKGRLKAEKKAAKARAKAMKKAEGK